MKLKSYRWIWSVLCSALLLAVALPGAAQKGEGAEPAESEATAKSESSRQGGLQEASPEASKGEVEEATRRAAQEQRQGGSEVDKVVPRTSEEALLLVASGRASDGIKIGDEPQPPDGEWLIADDGREYFWLRLPKTEPWYWADEEENKIRYQKYRFYEVERQDEEAFYVRQYRRAEIPPYDYFNRTPEELQAIRDSYYNVAELVDRLEIRDFGEGLPRQGQWRNGFDLADMNGDGHLDIVHAPPRKLVNEPVILLGDGEGSWRLWEGALYPDVGYAYGDARAADFNQDGHQDIALAMHLNGMAVLLGDGKGGFTSHGAGLDHWRPGKKEEPTFSSRAMRIADWDGDGRLDLVTLGEGPRPKLGVGGSRIPDGGSFGIVVYLNQGEDGWRREDTLSTQTNLFGDSLVLADFNGDGRLDAGTSSSTLGLREMVHMRQEDGSLRPMHLDLVRPNGYYKAVAAGDFDGDGRDDLAYSYVTNEDDQWRSGIDLLLSRDENTWERQPVQMVEGRDAIFAMTAGDVNGDGTDDIVGLDGEGGTYIFTRTAEGWGSERSPEMPIVETGCRGYHVELADLDGNGAPELVEGFAGEPSALFAPTKCVTRGALRAWSLAPKSADN